MEKQNYKKNRLLISVDNFLPITSSSSLVINELCKFLYDNNFEITILTNSRNINNKPKHINEIINFKSPKIHNINFISRGINEIIYGLILSYKILIFYKKYNNIFIYTPPLPSGLVSLILKNKIIINIQDIFPDNALYLGLLKKNIIFKFYKFLQKKIILNSKCVVVHSINNKKYLLKNYSHKDIVVIHNSIYNKFKYINKNDHIYNHKKIKIVYAGADGIAQDLEIIIKYLVKYVNIELTCFIDEKKVNYYKSKYNKNSNLLFYNKVSNDILNNEIRKFDFGLISLNFKNKTPSIPGKILSYLIQSKPIISVVNKESDLSYLYEEYKFGLIYNSARDLENLNNDLSSISNKMYSSMVKGSINLLDSQFNYFNKGTLIKKIFNE